MNVALSACARPYSTGNISIEIGFIIRPHTIVYMCLMQVSLWIPNVRFTILTAMEDSSQSRIILPAMIVSALLFIGVFIAFQSSKSRPSTIVLPGGNTYLGPSPAPFIAVNTATTLSGKIPIPEQTHWVTKNGTIFPYSFSYPEMLSLGVFPDDPYDAITVFYPGTDTNANIFFRVEDLTKLNKEQYIGKPLEYAGAWWKEYRWKGVASVSEFTNRNGLKGYRAKYLNDQGQTPYDHIFFEVPASPNASQGGPGTPNLIIWLSGNIFTPEVFDDIVDSVAWQAR